MNRSLLQFRQLSAMVVIATLSSAGPLMASSNPLRTVSPVQVEYNDWVFTPTMADDAVETILALRNPSTVVGDNVSAIWFHRQGVNDWDVFAWRSQDANNAVSYVMNSLMLDPDDFWKWHLDDFELVANPTAPEQFRGVFLDDPFVEVLDAMEDPAPFVEALDSVGWESAKGGFIEPRPCDDVVVVLGAIAAGVEAELDGEDGEAIAAAQLAECWPLCIPWTWTSGVTLGICTIAPWALDPGNPCEWMQSHCSVECHWISTKTCGYTRTRTRRKLDCTTCTCTDTGTQTGTVRCPSTQYYAPDCVNPIPGGTHVPPVGPDCTNPQMVPTPPITWTKCTLPC